MSLPRKRTDASDPLVLDRLVDGELTDSEEREVIAQLSQTPDGWRRCALALLEARCWQRAARQVQQLTHPQQSLAAVPLPKRPGRLAKGPDSPRSIRWPSALALCALFLIAYSIGTFLPSPWNSTAKQPVERPGVNESLAVNEQPSPKASIQPEEAGSQDLLLGNLTFVDNSGRPHQVPVYDWNQEVAEQLMYRSQPLPAEFVRQLKRHQVQTHQRYVPVRLQDGRQVVVPIQEVKIGPVGNTAY